MGMNLTLLKCCLCTKRIDSKSAKENRKIFFIKEFLHSFKIAFAYNTDPNVLLYSKSNWLPLPPMLLPMLLAATAANAAYCYCCQCCLLLVLTAANLLDFSVHNTVTCHTVVLCITLV